MPSTWISKSSSKQRAGRAGRVRSGHYYALFSHDRLDTFPSTTPAEILRSDLQEICLGVKVQSPSSRIENFLAGAIEPPNREVVRTTIDILKNLEALTPEEELTPLGQLLARLPLHPSLGKMVVLGIIFRCLDPILILCASTEFQLFLRPLGHERAADARRNEFGKDGKSDFLNVIQAFRYARQLHGTHQRQPKRLARLLEREYINAREFRNILQTMDQIEEILFATGLLLPYLPGAQNELQHGSPFLNENSNNISLLRALTVSGFHGNTALRKHPGIFITRQKKKVLVHPSSTNSLRQRSRGQKSKPDVKTLPRNAIVSYNHLTMRDRIIWMRETNLVTPLMVALFGHDPHWLDDTVIIGNWLQLPLKADCSYPPPQATVHGLRQSLDHMLSTAFNDFAQRRFSPDNEDRVAFTTALADLIQQNEIELRPDQRVSTQPKEKPPGDFPNKRSFFFRNSYTILERPTF